MQSEVINFDVTKAEIEEASQYSLSLTVKDAGDLEAFEEVKKFKKVWRDKRLLVEKRRKALNLDAQSHIKNINGQAKELQLLIEPNETHLAIQEKIVTEEQARLKVEKEAQAVLRIKTMGQRLIKAGAIFDGDAYGYGEGLLNQTTLKYLTDEQFEEIFVKIEAWKKDFVAAEFAAEKKRQEELDAQKAREEKLEAELAIQKAASDKLAEQQKLLNEEKEKLAEERRQIEQDKIDAKREEEQAKQDKLDAETRKLEAKILADQHAKEVEEAKVKAAADEKARLEEKAEEQERERIEAEQRVKARQAEEERLAPDTEKLLTFVASLSGIKYPKVVSDEAIAIIQFAVERISLLANTIEEQAKTMSE